MEEAPQTAIPREARWSRLEPRRTLDPDLGRKMLACAFPSTGVRVSEPLSGGYRNANFKVHLDSPSLPVVVLRIYEHDASLCRKEVDLMRLVAKKVSVPEVLFANFTNTDLPPFAILTFIDGISLRELKRAGNGDAIAQATQSSGALLAAVGGFTFSKSGWLSAGLSVTAPLLEGSEPLPRFVDLCLESPHLQRRVAPEVRSRVHELVWSWAPRLRELDCEKSLVHCDFGLRNLLVREERGRWGVAALLDWEFAVSGSPLIDVAHFLRYEVKERPLLEPHFSRGFQEAGGVLPLDWRQLSRIIDLSALVDTLVRAELPADVEKEIVELIHATVEERDPQL
jgi:Ser/Thr protein kinase RdoA (MazF antagonist)